MPPGENQGPSEGDVVFNRANVALARSQKLLQSWLPQPTEGTANTTTTTEYNPEEDEELFKQTSERTGVGAIDPENEEDALIKRRGPSTQKLAEKLLGKKAAKGHMASSKAPDRFGKSKQPVQDAKQVSSIPAEESDEEEGRASLVASKRKRPAHDVQKPLTKTSGAAKGESTETVRLVAEKSKTTTVQADSSDEEEDPRPIKKRGGSYLDQLLAEKASKKKKKQKAGGAV